MLVCFIVALCFEFILLINLDT